MKRLASIFLFVGIGLLLVSVVWPIINVIIDPPNIIGGVDLPTGIHLVKCRLQYGVEGIIAAFSVILVITGTIMLIIKKFFNK